MPDSLRHSVVTWRNDIVKNHVRFSRRSKLTLFLQYVTEGFFTLLHSVTRREYGERRFQGLGRIGQRLHVAVITLIGDALHVISLRKANRKAVAWYDEDR
jgi:uncharacterized DUF497 family protein